MANFEGFCPVRDILSQIGDKWSVLAMVAMQKYGVCRFRDFQKDMPDVSSWSPGRFTRKCRPGWSIG